MEKLFWKKCNLNEKKNKKKEKVEETSLSFYFYGKEKIFLIDADHMIFMNYLDGILGIVEEAYLKDIHFTFGFKSIQSGQFLKIVLYTGRIKNTES